MLYPRGKRPEYPLDMSLKNVYKMLIGKPEGRRETTWKTYVQMGG
jgi:hypothetical protein